MELLRKLAARHRWLAFCALWLGLSALAAAVLWQDGAFDASFDGSPDEAPHFLTGVMIRDYVVSGAGQPPQQYAERYYAAYPKIAFGVWPPLFHLLQGAWYIPLPAGRAAAILLMAALLALWMIVAYRFARPELPAAAAGLLSLSLLLLPAVHRQFLHVIADAALAPLVLLAAIAFTRYLDSGATRPAIWFGLFSGLALLTKYNAGLLLFIPPVAIAAARRWDLWLDWRLWASAAVAGLIAGPWYLLNTRMIALAADPGPEGLPDRWLTGLQNATLLAGASGWPAAVLAGLAVAMGLGQRRIPPAFAVSIALLTGTLAMHSALYPISDMRYLLPAIPALLFLVFQGLGALAARLPVLPRPAATALLTIAVLWAPAVASARRTTTPRPQWREVASAARTLNPRVMLVSGPGGAEGAVVAEVALLDAHRHQNPQWRVLRGSKVLAASTWMGGGYRLRHRSAAEIAGALDQWGVQMVTVGLESPLMEHNRLLLEALGSAAGSWREAAPRPGLRTFFRRTLAAAGPAVARPATARAYLD